MAYSVLKTFGDVKTSIEVCIKLITALSTSEDALMRSVAPSNMTAPRTSLGCISCVSIFNSNAFEDSLVLDKLLKLKERPTHPLVTIFLLNFGSLVDALEFLKHNGISGLQSCNDLLGDAVIDILAEKLFSSFDFVEVSFSRMSFGLQNRPQSFVSLTDPSNLSSTKEAFIRTNSKFIDSPVNANNLSGGWSFRCFDLEDDIQKDFVFPDDQLSRLPVPRQIFLMVVRNSDIEFESSIHSEQGDLISVPPDIEGFAIVSNAALFGLWFVEDPRITLLFLCFGELLALKRFDRPECLSGFCSCRDGKISREIFPGCFVGLMVQRDTIEVLFSPTGIDNEVVSFCVGLHCGHNICWKQREFESDCASMQHIRVLYKNACIMTLKNSGNILREGRSRNSPSTTRAALRAAAA
jgi:hypothetical protein